MNSEDTQECSVPLRRESPQGGWWIGANEHREDQHRVGSHHQRGRVSGRRTISPEIGRPSLEHAKRDPRRVFGALPNSSYISGSQGYAIARDLESRSVALPLSTVRAVEQAGRVSSGGREGDYSPINRCDQDHGDAYYWEEECSRLRRQLAILTHEYEKSECEKQRMLREDVANCSRQITELRRAIEAQTQLVLETLVAAQRVIAGKADDLPDSCVQSPRVLPDSGKTPASTSGGVSTVLPEPATHYPATLGADEHQQQQQQQHLHRPCLRFEEFGSTTYAHRDEQRRTPDNPRQPKRNVEHAASRTRGHSSRASLVEHRETLLSGAENPDSVASPAGGMSSICSSQRDGRGTRQLTKYEGMHRADILYDAAMLATKSRGAAVDQHALDGTGPESNVVRTAAQEDAPGWYRRLTSGSDMCNRTPKSGWKPLAGGGQMGCGRESELWEWNGRKVLFEPSQTTPRRATPRAEEVSGEERGSRGEISSSESKRRAKTQSFCCSNVKPKSGHGGHPKERKEVQSERQLEEGNVKNYELQAASKDEIITSSTLNPKASSNLAYSATVVYESPGKNIRMTKTDSRETHQDPPALIAQAGPSEQGKAITCCLERYPPQFPQAEQGKGTTIKAETMTGETIGAAVVQSTTPKPIIKRDDEEDEENTDSYCRIVDG